MKIIILGLSINKNKSKFISDQYTFVGNNKISNKIDNLNDNGISTDMSYNLNDYPLSLLPNIETLLTAGIIFYIVILNVNLVQFIINKNYTRYLPDNKLGNFFKLIINRYISI
jgi:hypothetical protein